MVDVTDGPNVHVMLVSGEDSVRVPPRRQGRGGGRQEQVRASRFPLL